MILSTDGLVLKVTDCGEDDRIVTLLTSEYGIIHAFANRAKKINGNMLSSTQILTYGNFELYSSKGNYTINNAKTKELFFSLRQDILKLSLGQYFCSLAYCMVREMVEAKSELKLILNSLYLLSKDKRDINFIKSVTELKLSSLCGFMPDFTCCNICRCEQMSEPKCIISEGTFCCNHHNNNGFQLTNGVFNAIKYVCLEPIDKIYSFVISDYDLNLFSAFTEKYIIYNIQKMPKTLEFYKSIKGEINE